MKKEFRFKIDVPKYIYPVGKGGERFAEGLKKGEIYAAYCENCDNYMMPPTAYCPRCFSEIKDYKKVTHAYLDLYTILWKDFNGNDLDEPIVYGFIRFEVDERDVEGGLIHRLKIEDPSKLVLGVPVEPRFKPAKERRGLITDIEYFEIKLE